MNFVCRLSELRSWICYVMELVKYNFSFSPQTSIAAVVQWFSWWTCTQQACKPGFSSCWYPRVIDAASKTCTLIGVSEPLSRGLSDVNFGRLNSVVSRQICVWVCVCVCVCVCDVRCQCDPINTINRQQHVNWKWQIVWHMLLWVWYGMVY